LVDAAIACAQVVISLVVRRFRCKGADCSAVTFAEEVAGLTSPHARYTPLARRMVRLSGWRWLAGPVPGRGRRAARACFFAGKWEAGLPGEGVRTRDKRRELLHDRPPGPLPAVSWSTG